MDQIVTLIPGDGIGPEVTASARDVVLPSGARGALVEVAVGMREGERPGIPLPAAIVSRLKSAKVMSDNGSSLYLLFLWRIIVD